MIHEKKKKKKKETIGVHERHLMRPPFDHVQVNSVDGYHVGIQHFIIYGEFFLTNNVGNDN